MPSLASIIVLSFCGGEKMKFIVLATWVLMISLGFPCSSMAQVKKSPDTIPMLIRLKVEEHSAAKALDVSNDALSGTAPESTTRIVGRDGLCVDVKDGIYRDGIALQLWPCKTNEDANQLWTLKADGTIRSNGKCMTASSLQPGTYVMIKNCTAAPPETSRWKLTENNNIVVSGTILVLSALSTSVSGQTVGLVLRLESSIFASRHTWHVTNNTIPAVGSIVGLKGLCLQSVGNMNVWLDKCSGKIKQKWSFYPDLTIRPKGRQDLCITAENDLSGSVVTLRSCCVGLPGQRWVFTRKGYILNQRNGLVFDLKQSNPSLHQIIIYKATGTPNQQWTPKFE